MYLFFFNLKKEGTFALEFEKAVKNSLWVSKILEELQIYKYFSKIFCFKL